MRRFTRQIKPALLKTEVYHTIASSGHADAAGERGLLLENLDKVKRTDVREQVVVKCRQCRSRDLGLPLAEDIRLRLLSNCLMTFLVQG